MSLRAALAVQRFVLRTEQGPLRLLWAFGHTLLTRGVSSYLGRGRCASAYLRGSFAADEPVYGLSDVDLVIVAPSKGRQGAVREAIRKRWDGLSRRLPVIERLVSVAVYEEAELLDASTASWLTYGLEEDRAAGLSRLRETDELGLGLRPELYGPTRDWKLLAGRERRPRVSTPQDRQRWIPAWLELQWWWRQACLAAADPSGFATPYLCVKLIAEPARIWLWVAHGERVKTRREALERSLRLLPEEEGALRAALLLQRRLTTSPEAPVRAATAFLTRMSSRLGERLERESGPGTEVRLVSGGEADLAAMAGHPEPLPLVDWRALVMPWRPADEMFALVDGDPSDPESLAQTATHGEQPPHPALQADRLLVFPTAELWGHSLLRAVQCAATDPVSFALIGQRNLARFTDLPGWSATDVARRAVAEHRDWMNVEGLSAPNEPALETLLRAARAALFHESLQEGAPHLPLTMAATTACLAVREPRIQQVADHAYAAYRAGILEDQPVEPALVASLRAHVCTLPAYRGKVDAAGTRSGS